MTAVALWLLALIALINAPQSVCGGSSLRVVVEQGVLQGTETRSHAGNSIYAFQGIPYAAPPVGPLRFKEPEEPAKWEGVREANKANPVCIQRDVLFSHSNKIIGQEDCLYLSVYTPRLPRKDENVSRLPVLVFFHGGGWLCGSSGIYGPNYLLDQDIILVTPSYRLGSFGFMSTEDKACPGNFGLKDQVAALKWVKRNIAAFGGDESMVTISGESVGGVSVHYHMISPMSKGLFNRAISMSGTVYAPWALSYKPAVQAKRFGKIHGCPTENSEKLVECLRKIDAVEIVDKTDLLYEWGIEPILPFRPAVEPLGHGGQVFLPASREELIKEAERLDPENSIPWMVGFTSQDGGFRVAALAHDRAVLKEIDREFSTIGPLTLNFTTEDNKAAAEKIREFYFGDKKIDIESRFEMLRMFTDRQFLLPILNALKMMRRYGTARPIYFYQFGYRGKHSMSENWDTNSDTDYGVVHMDDLQYIFSIPSYFPAVPKDAKSKDTKVMRFMTRLVTDFATTGLPTPSNDLIKLKEDKDFQWNAISKVFPLEIANLNSAKVTGYLQETEDIVKSYKFWRSLRLQEEGWTAREEMVDSSRDEL